jgi:Sulfatase
MNATFTPSRPASGWQRAVNWPFAIAEREPVGMALGLALAASCWLYRALLAREIFSCRAQPFSLRPEQVPVPAFLITMGGDWLTVLAVTLVFLGLKSWLRLRLPQLMATPEMQVAEVCAASLVLIGFSLVLRVHGVLLVQLETGLTWTFVQMAHELVGTADFFRLFSGYDLACLAAPLLVFAAVLADADRLRKIFRPMALTFTVAALALQALPGRGRLTPELADNPVPYLLKDLVRDTAGYFWRNGNGYRRSEALPGEAQQQSLALVDDAFVARPPGPGPGSRSLALTAAGKPWNVLLFVMESTGADYAFETPFGQQMPMPFLRRLAGQGWYCTNHFSACNSSPGAAFAILTGLYPPPEPAPFSLRKDASVPIWNEFLGIGYDCFLIHPSSSTYSFPVDLFRNSGFTNLYFQEQLPPGPLPDRTEMARNEINTMRFLERRLDAAHEPFLGVYWSFVPHYPYTDYGAEYKIRPGKTKHDRYIDNLRLLDTQLERLFHHLEQTGLADRTVVILVGDHGEAFGQHPGFWSHSFGSYAEMYRVPLLFWQPRLIAPRVETKPTSHVDILPTLLDLLAEPWEPSRLQGESLLRESSRKYIFAMDAQADYITAISTNLNKISICLPDDEAEAYNLAKDPRERLPLNEQRFPAQIQALLEYHNYQKHIVENYNSGILARRQLPPQTP